METRTRIKSKLGRILYLPFAIIEWCFYTITFSTFGLFTLTLFGIPAAIVNLAMLNTDTAKECLEWAAIPIVLPFKWWVDYIRKGEIGLYD